MIDTVSHEYISNCDRVLIAKVSEQKGGKTKDLAETSLLSGFINNSLENTSLKH